MFCSVISNQESNQIKGNNSRLPINEAMYSRNETKNDSNNDLQQVIY